jgi:hypothetical protein
MRKGAENGRKNKISKEKRPDNTKGYQWRMVKK